MDRTSPGGRVLGIDIIPAQPPKGVSTLQGNFLSEAIQNEAKRLLQTPTHGRLRQEKSWTAQSPEDAMTQDDLRYLDEDCSLRSAAGEQAQLQSPGEDSPPASRPWEACGGTVDVVLSDMSAPWEQTSGFYKRSLSNPYRRMMNTSGMRFRDHARR